MLPIAVLPAAGILLRLGEDDMLGGSDITVIGPFFDAMNAGGSALFDNLGFLFAVGVAIGMSKKADGSTALAAVAGYLVMQAVFEAMSPVVLEGITDGDGEQLMIDYQVFGGILVGLITAWLFDRYYNIELPQYLAFFGGRRFVPIVVSLSTLFLGFGLSYLFPAFNSVLTSFGEYITASGALGAFVYGFANRMLIPLGLHHLINTFIWFIYGEYPTDGGVATGELTRFNAGDVTAGTLTSGFYPILMFGLPAAALAMIHVAKPKQKKVAVSVFGAAGLTAFLTGITEPLEFAFMFLAFPLYVLHAVITGLSLALTNALDIHLGFSFSAGLIDLVLYGRAPAAQNILLLVGIGLGFAVLYYVLFRFVIVKWNLRTPGRLTDEDFEASQAAQYGEDTDGDGDGSSGGGTSVSSPRGEQLIAAFGGRDNLVHVDACITRLRMEVADKSLVNKQALTALGSSGVLEVGNNVQAVFGAQSDSLKDDIKAALANPGSNQSTAQKDEFSDEFGPDSDFSYAGGAVSNSINTTIAATSALDHDPLTVLAPIPGTAVDITEVPDKTFAEGTVGPGVAIQPPNENVTAVAPVAGKVMQLFPHAFAILTPDKKGVLVHLGIDTVNLKGEGFTTHVAKGETVKMGQTMITYDVSSVEQSGHPTVVPVVIMDARDATVEPLTGAGTEVTAMNPLFTVNDNGS
ncbi:MAG TPA: glucose PTS transporter subunit IIA [Candidatus Corynebacterium avicola]|uniref:Glucose PTS transporter subunit IIA n=1 Tax=Candidatus Corynebacterium avicola TaxID=2838527 RepID=A0A9D1RQH1_9CORY|nr:glucose PTS transporter subunit IIA [Candidatus Corynebacterium avicola]